MKTEDILPKDKLETLYLKEKISDQQIADKVHLSLGQVHRLRSKWKIRTLEQFERHHKQNINQYETNLIVGNLLGDGHMRKRNGKDTYPQLMIEQSVKHKEYLYWLKNELKGWLFKPNKPILTNRKYNKITDSFNHSLAFQTICHPTFLPIFKAFYKSGKKTINKEFIFENFNEISLAIWMMDDGTLTGNQKRNMIATNNFSYDEVNFLRDMLKTKFDLKTWICKRTKKYNITYEIAFDKKSSFKIADLIGEIVIPSMQYKLLHPETAKDTA